MVKFLVFVVIHALGHNAIRKDVGTADSASGYCTQSAFWELFIGLHFRGPSYSSIAIWSKEMAHMPYHLMVTGSAI